ncbi:MAG: hypothetical protein ACK56I_23845, partial [bacterium]
MRGLVSPWPMIAHDGVFEWRLSSLGVFEWRLSPITLRQSLFQCAVVNYSPQWLNLVHPLSIVEPPGGRAPTPSRCPANAADAHIRVVVFTAPLVPLL